MLRTLSFYNGNDSPNSSVRQPFQTILQFFSSLDSKQTSDLNTQNNHLFDEINMSLFKEQLETLFPQELTDSIPFITQISWQASVDLFQGKLTLKTYNKIVTLVEKFNQEGASFDEINELFQSILQQLFDESPEAHKRLIDLITITVHLVTAKKYQASAHQPPKKEVSEPVHLFLLVIQQILSTPKDQRAFGYQDDDAYWGLISTAASLFYTDKNLRTFYLQVRTLQTTLNVNRTANTLFSYLLAFTVSIAKENNYPTQELSTLLPSGSLYQSIFQEIQSSPKPPSSAPAQNTIPHHPPLAEQPDEFKPTPSIQSTFGKKILGCLLMTAGILLVAAAITLIAIAIAGSGGSTLGFILPLLANLETPTIILISSAYAFVTGAAFIGGNYLLTTQQPPTSFPLASQATPAP